MAGHLAVLQVGFLELRVEALDLILLSLVYLGEQGLGDVAATRGAVLLPAQDPTKVQTSSPVDAENCFRFPVVFDQSSEQCQHATARGALESCTAFGRAIGHVPVVCELWIVPGVLPGTEKRKASLSSLVCVVSSSVDRYGC